MSGPVVICINFESYVCAVAAMETLAGQLPEVATHIEMCLADFKRAHATYAVFDANITTPALLRRQAD
jgi:hypothetical protein